MHSLNEIYETQSFIYWCDSFGEINNPYDKTWSPESLADITVMPSREQELYKMKTSDRPEYVVSWNYKAYTAYTALFDTDYLNDILPDVPAARQEELVRQYAETLSFQNCEILYGKDTDPIGHEIILMIPYDQRHNKDSLIRMFDQCVFKDFEEFIAPEPDITPKTLYTVSTLYENADTHICAYRIRQICETAEAAKKAAQTHMERFQTDEKDELSRFTPDQTTRYPLYGSLMESTYDQNDETANHEYYNQISWGCGQDYRRYAVMVDAVPTGECFGETED